MANVHSDESDGEFEDVLVDHFRHLEVQPYMYEPKISIDRREREDDSSEDSSSEEEDDHQDRIGHRDWCLFCVFAVHSVCTSFLCFCAV